MHKWLMLKKKTHSWNISVLCLVLCFLYVNAQVLGISAPAYMCILLGWELLTPKTGNEGSLNILATIDGWDYPLARQFLRSTKGNSFFSCRREIANPPTTSSVCILSLSDEGNKKRITCLDILQLRQITLRKMKAWLFGFKVRLGGFFVGYVYFFKCCKLSLER